MPHTTQSPGLPSTTRHPVVGCLHKSFGGSFHFPTRARKLLECSLPDGFSGVSLCQPKDSFPVAVPLLSPSLCPLRTSPPLSSSGTVFTNSFFISSNLWVCPGVPTNYRSTRSHSVLAPQSRGCHHGTRCAGARAPAGEEMEATT